MSTPTKTVASIHYHDTCLSDYFRGSDNPTVCVAVDSTSTVKDVLSSLYEQDLSDVLSDDECDAFYRAVEEMQQTNKARFDKSWCNLPSDAEDVYAYFSVSFKQESLDPEFCGSEGCEFLHLTYIE